MITLGSLYLIYTRLRGCLCISRLISSEIICFMSAPLIRVESERGIGFYKKSLVELNPQP